MAKPETVEATNSARREVEWVHRARRRLLPFAVYTYDGRYRVRWHHKILALVIELWEDRDFPALNRLALSVPPRHGKTELASIRLPAWILGRHPSDSIIAASRDAQYAKRLSRQVKRVITSKEFERVFPNVKIPERHSRSDERKAWRNTAKHWQTVGHGGEYEAFGAGQGISGVGGHYLFVEDPYPSREEAESATYRQRVNTWYDDDLHPRREDDLESDVDRSNILIIHTRWHQNDLIGHVTRTAEEYEETDNWVRLNIPALLMDGHSMSVEFHGYDDEERARVLERMEARGLPVDWEHGTLRDPRTQIDEAIWPDRRSADEFVADRKSNERKFWSEDQGEPTPPGGTIFERPWFEADPESDNDDLAAWAELPRPGEFYWFCDPKHGSSEPDSSEAVVQLWYQPNDEPGRAYLVAEHRGRWSEPETEEQLLELDADPVWRQAGEKLIEPEGDGRALVDNLGSEIPGLDLIDTKKVRRSKEERARSIASFVKSGSVLLPPTDVEEDVGTLVTQLTQFPGAAHDDRVDTFVYAVDHLLRDAEKDDTSDHFADMSRARRNLS